MCACLYPWRSVRGSRKDGREVSSRRALPGRDTPLGTSDAVYRYIFYREDKSLQGPRVQLIITFQIHIIQCLGLQRHSNICRSYN